MAREIINETDVEKVIGGSIIFNVEHTTCGYNRNDQYAVLDYGKVIDFIKENRNKMSEKNMLSKMVSKGYLANL